MLKGLSSIGSIVKVDTERDSLFAITDYKDNGLYSVCLLSHRDSKILGLSESEMTIVKERLLDSVQLKTIEDLKVLMDKAMVLKMHSVISETYVKIDKYINTLVSLSEVMYNIGE